MEHGGLAFVSELVEMGDVRVFPVRDLKLVSRSEPATSDRDTGRCWLAMAFDAMLVTGAETKADFASSIKVNTGWAVGF